MEKRKDFTLCVLKTNFPCCFLGCVSSLSACCWMGKRIVFHYVRSFTSVLNFFAVLHVSLCYREKNKTDIKDMFNSRYIYNKQITPWKVLCMDFFFHSLQNFEKRASEHFL